MIKTIIIKIVFFFITTFYKLLKRTFKISKLVLPKTKTRCRKFIDNFFWRKKNKSF